MVADELEQVNGTVRQKGSTSEMLFDIATLIAHCSHIMTLNDGDLLLTGTPSGVGPLIRGDTVDAELTGLVSVRFPVQLTMSLMTTQSADFSRVSFR